MLPRFSSWAITAGATSLEKKIIGFKCKRVIDYSRMKYLESKLPHLQVGAQMYCNPITESPECTLLVAFPKQ